MPSRSTGSLKSWILLHPGACWTSQLFAGFFHDMQSSQVWWKCTAMGILKLVRRAQSPSQFATAPWSRLHSPCVSKTAPTGFSWWSMHYMLIWIDNWPYPTVCLCQEWWWSLQDLSGNHYCWMRSHCAPMLRLTCACKETKILLSILWFRIVQFLHV